MKRGRYQCQICGKLGHYRKNCPKLADILVKDKNTGHHRKQTSASLTPVQRPRKCIANINSSSDSDPDYTPGDSSYSENPETDDGSHVPPCSLLALHTDEESLHGSVGSQESAADGRGSPHDSPSLDSPTTKSFSTPTNRPIRRRLHRRPISSRQKNFDAAPITTAPVRHRNLASITITVANGNLPVGYEECTKQFIQNGVDADYKCFAAFERGTKKQQLHLQGCAEFDEPATPLGKRHVVAALNEYYPMIVGRKVTVKWCKGQQQLCFMLGYCQKDKGKLLVCFLVTLVTRCASDCMHQLFNRYGTLQGLVQEHQQARAS